MSIDWKTPPFFWPSRQTAIALIVIFGLLFIAITLVFRPEVPDSDILKLLLGALIGWGAAIVQFDFGSSKGSEKKDDFIMSPPTPSKPDEPVPPITPAAPTVTKLSIALIACLLASMILTPAFAQNKLPTPTSLLNRFDQVQVEDLTVALAYAKADEDRAAISCYEEWLSQVQKIAKIRADNPDPTGPQVITAFQKARGLIRRLDTSSPLRMACAALAADAKQDVKQFLSSIVTGVAVKAFLPF